MIHVVCVCEREREREITSEFGHMFPLVPKAFSILGLWHTESLHKEHTAHLAFSFRI